MKKIIFLILITFGTGLHCAEHWRGDLSALENNHWDKRKVKHLFERAGFGLNPAEINRLSKVSIEVVVNSLFPDSLLIQADDFDHSGIHDSTLEPFPPSRPAATKLAKETGQAMGVSVKPSGNRRLQPVVDRFFYWLRASRLETHRLGYWWAQKMLSTPYPLVEKMGLLWHGHFATSENKVRDYRKMHRQNELFREKGLGNFRDLLIAVAQDPAMLSFLDAGRNIKGAPNENFAREVMELFTMGVGHYSERDIREAARAFTGWNFNDLSFTITEGDHDDGVKQFMGQSGNYNGVDIIDLILKEKVAAEFIAKKIYTYFVTDEISEKFGEVLGEKLTSTNYEIQPFLKTIFMSKDFYSPQNMGNRIKPPVELVISTYKKLGVTIIPGVPDFNTVTSELGQQLFYPPTVAGWKQGQSWMTPGLLLSRGNLFYDIAFPDINFIATDRYPSGGYKTIRSVNDKLALGLDVTSATSPDDVDTTSMSMMMVDRDEDFNTRLGTFRGWQQALQRVKPIKRDTASFSLTETVLSAGCNSTSDAVEHLIERFISVAIDSTTKNQISDFLTREIGTSNLSEASSYMEEGLRLTLHLILSLPEYQVS